MVFSASPRTFVPLLALFLITLFFWNVKTPGATDRFLSMMSPRTFDPTTDLAVSVSQISGSSPPRLSLSVKNNYEQPVTVLRWDTPLDPMALKLGVIGLTPKDKGSPLELATIAVRRMMPPMADQFITIQPGESAVNEIELGAPVIREEMGLGGKVVEVEAKGSWGYAWPLDNEAVVGDRRAKVGGDEDSGAFRGAFASGKTDVSF